MDASFSLNTEDVGVGSVAMDAFARGWHERVGQDQRLPTFTASSEARVSGAVSVERLVDVTLIGADMTSRMRTASLPEHHDREVRLYAVRRGSMTLDDPDGRGTHVIPAGGFAIQHVRCSVHFETAPGLSLQVVTLPAEPLAPLLNGRLRSGSLKRTEMRLLLAHARSVQSSSGKLGQAGLWAVRNTLIELTRAVVLEGFDDQEVRTAPALAAAARALADARLTEPDLSSAMLARELHVSLRTLQRAFALTGESVSEYVHRRRLEEARRALTAVPGLKVSEVAARWQFSDSSHFVRAYRRLFGTTPGGVSRRP